MEAGKGVEQSRQDCVALYAVFCMVLLPVPFLYNFSLELAGVSPVKLILSSLKFTGLILLVVVYLRLLADSFLFPSTKYIADVLRLASIASRLMRCTSLYFCPMLPTSITKYTPD